MKTLRMILLVLVLVLLMVDRSSVAAQSVAPTPKPNLVIVVSVDMLSAEIMDRYTAGLPGGLGKLLKEGVVFENAYQEHAFTETCPGHATLLSGRYPASTGIGTNSWNDSSTGKRTYCVEDDQAKTFGASAGTVGASDVQFRGTTLGTWLKDAFPDSRVFAVAGKDRSAILDGRPEDRRRVLVPRRVWVYDVYRVCADASNMARELQCRSHASPADGDAHLGFHGPVRWTHHSRRVEGRPHRLSHRESSSEVDPDSGLSGCAARRLHLERDTGRRLLESIPGFSVLGQCDIQCR